MTLALSLGYRSRRAMRASLTPREMAEWYAYYTATDGRPDATQRALARLGQAVFAMIGGDADKFNPAGIAPSMGVECVASKAADTDEEHQRVADSALAVCRLLAGGKE